MEYLRTDCVLGNIPLSTSDRLSDDNEDVDGDRLGSTTLLFSSILETVFDFSCVSAKNIFVVTGNVCDFRCVSCSHSGSSCGGASFGLLASGGRGAAFFLRPKHLNELKIIFLVYKIIYKPKSKYNSRYEPDKIVKNDYYIIF